MVLANYSTTFPATGTVPSYISIPTIELVRSYLCSYPAGALVNVTVRGLADVIGRGKRAWGAISPALKRLERDGYIACLPTSEGKLVEVLKSDQVPDRLQRAFQSDQVADRPKTPAAASAETIMAPRSDESVVVSDQVADRMSLASQCDQGVDRTDVYGTSPSWNQQQQRTRACEREKSEPEREATPALITASEWAKIRAAAPVYTESDLVRDLGKLATRAGIGNPVGLIIAALRANEPIYSRQELQERAATLAPAPPEVALDARAAAPCQGWRRGRRGDVERHIEGRPVSADDLKQAAELEAHVRSLAPRDADDEDIGVLILALSSGATDPDALAQMEAERTVRAARPSSDEVFDALRQHTRQQQARRQRR